MSDIEKTSKQTYKDQRLLVRLDRQERQMIEGIAQRWGMPLSGAIRRLIREEAEGNRSATERD